jgi:hypothetical protein
MYNIIYLYLEKCETFHAVLRLSELLLQVPHAVLGRHVHRAHILQLLGRRLAPDLFLKKERKIQLRNVTFGTSPSSLRPPNMMC